jgi:hypothetical protein
VTFLLPLKQDARVNAIFTILAIILFIFVKINIESDTSPSRVNYMFEEHLWSGGQSSGYRSRSPVFDSQALPDFLRNDESGTVSTQPRDDIEELLNEKVTAPV